LPRRATEKRVNSERWHLLKASAERLENSICAMREMLALVLPEHTRQVLTQNIKDGEALITQLRDKLGN
jgi:hypothetical protein